MDYDADLNGPVELLAPDPGNLAEAGSPVFPCFETLLPPAPAEPTAFVDPVSHPDSSLIEDAWISGHGQGACDHLLEHRLMAQEFEGLRLGRELHDSTGQLILALRLSVARLREVSQPSEWDEIFDEISDTACQLDREIRSFAYLHYPAELGKGGLVDALKSLARGFAKRTGLKVDFRAICNRTIGNEAESVALLRVAQEALTNVHRHARAHMVRMSLVERDGAVELSVEDDGRGIVAPDGDAVALGVGLQGMRHRVERLGGNFAIERLKRGTRLIASLVIGRKAPSPLPKPDGGKAEDPDHAKQGAKGG